MVEEVGEKFRGFGMHHHGLHVEEPTRLATGGKRERIIGTSIEERKFSDEFDQSIPLW